MAKSFGDSCLVVNRIFTRFVLLAVICAPALAVKSRETGGSVTFHKEIAPIIYHQCAGCHREGQAAPFNLLTFEDVRKRAKEVAKVTHEGVMPPWLPEPGYGI